MLRRRAKRENFVTAMKISDCFGLISTLTVLDIGNLRAAVALLALARALLDSWGGCQTMMFSATLGGILFPLTHTLACCVYMLSFTVYFYLTAVEF